MEHLDGALTRPVRRHTARGMEHAAVSAGHIAFERLGSLGLVTLTRPDALNALTHDMVLALAAQLDAWATDDRVATVAITGQGRAFSAGGDIRAIYDRGIAGEPFDRFFADEYALNIQIKRYPKPYVALVDGIAMGGGVGVAYHASHVVVGERARFAMPECGIGFFPDVGGTALLAPLGAPGRYLGLTGARIGPAAQVAAGLANAHVPRDRHGELIADLAEGAPADEAVGGRHQEPEGETIAHPIVLTAFARNSPLEVLATLNDERTDESGAVAERIRSAVAALGAKSPTSLRVAARQLAARPEGTFERTMGIEARIAHRMLRGRDFYEGIRTAIIDKGGVPQWSPETLDEVGDEAVAEYFQPVESGPLAAISALADQPA